jgi:hypothetical protein
MIWFLVTMHNVFFTAVKVCAAIDLRNDCAVAVVIMSKHPPLVH